MFTCFGVKVYNIMKMMLLCALAPAAKRQKQRLTRLYEQLVNSKPQHKTPDKCNERKRNENREGINLFKLRKRAQYQENNRHMDKINVDDVRRYPFYGLSHEYKEAR